LDFGIAAHLLDPVTQEAHYIGARWVVRQDNLEQPARFVMSAR
jgi:hypothetical protein